MKYVHQLDDDLDDYFFSGGSSSDENKKDKNDPKNKYGKDASEFKMDTKGLVREERGCTNKGCLLIYIAFLGAMGYATIYGFQNGQYHKLTAPIDGGGNFCGFDEMEGYGNMVLTDFAITNVMGILDSGLCVSECPQGPDFNFIEGTNCMGNGNIGCSEGRSYDTIDTFDFCIPESQGALTDEEWQGVELVRQSFKDSAAGSWFLDMYNSSRAIYTCFGLAFFWSMVFIYLMSLFAETLAWCCIVIIQIALLAGTAVSFMMWGSTQTEYGQQMAASGYDSMTADQQAAWDQAQQNPKQWLAATAVFGILSLIFLCAVCCGKDQLRRAIDVIDAAADFVAGTKRILLSPILHFFFTIIITVIWMGCMLCVASLDPIVVNPLIPQGRSVEWTKQTMYMALFMLFGWFWITAWIEYTSRFIAIVAAATYYFNNHRDAQDKEDGAEVCYGFKCAYVNHIGSIAFGAFIIALVRFIKFIFYQISKKLEEQAGENPAVKCAVGCAKCLLNCIEKICDYLNEAAFCYMAVTGDGFLESAWNGFLLNLKHGLEFAFANTIAKVFIFIGKLGIVATNCFTLFMLMKYVTKDMEEVKSIWPPMIIVAIVTYMAASLFLGLFDVAVMSLLTCLCVDIEQSEDGTPVYGPATFHDNYVKKVKDANAEDEKKTNEVA